MSPNVTQVIMISQMLLDIYQAIYSLIMYRYTNIYLQGSEIGIKSYVSVERPLSLTADFFLFRERDSHSATHLKHVFFSISIAKWVRFFLSSKPYKSWGILSGLFGGGGKDWFKQKYSLLKFRGI